jgi:hypothetical protein
MNRLPSVAALAVVTAFACATSKAPPEPAGDAGIDAGPVDAGPVAGPNTTVSVFQGAHMTGSNRQTDTMVNLPTGLFSNITLTWKLSCPPAGCDPWDRIAELHIVQTDGQGSQQTVEVARLITPYGVGATWSYDVTDLAPILTGPQTFRLFVDTWVDGWMADISLQYTGGIPTNIPVAVTNLWRNGDAVYGDPSQPIAAQFPPQTATRAENEKLELRAIVTGHGQGNFENCSEFCEVTHTVDVGSTPFALGLWRTDCAQNPVSNQQGTWQYDRAGWCPGADVRPFIFDVTSAVPAGTTTPVTISFQDYTNSCRPDAGMTTCNTCASGTDCNYNSDGHTEPFYDTTVELVRFQSGQ